MELLIDLIPKVTETKKRFIYSERVDGVYLPQSSASFSPQPDIKLHRVISTEEARLKLASGHTPRQLIDYLNSLPSVKALGARIWRRQNKDKVSKYETSEARREAKRLHARKRRAEKAKQSNWQQT